MMKILKIILYSILIAIMALSLYVIISRMVFKKDIVNIFGYSYLIVRSNSMYPDLEINDIIIIKMTKECKRGDIITYEKDDVYITHRVIEIDGEKIITKGDSNNTADEFIKKEQIVGVVKKIIG